VQAGWRCGSGGGVGGCPACGWVFVPVYISNVKNGGAESRDSAVARQPPEAVL
jgi:hypothetical protein